MMHPKFNFVFKQALFLNHDDVQKALLSYGDSNFVANETRAFKTTKEALRLKKNNAREALDGTARQAKTVALSELNSACEALQMKQKDALEALYERAARKAQGVRYDK